VADSDSDFIIAQ